jgi:hypothetical protein
MDSASDKERFTPQESEPNKSEWGESEDVSEGGELRLPAEDKGKDLSSNAADPIKEIRRRAGA